MKKNYIYTVLFSLILSAFTVKFVQNRMTKSRREYLTDYSHRQM